MAYAIINSYIPTSLYPLKATYTMAPEFITIHNTYNDATAANEIAFMTRNTSTTSYHVAVDDRHVVQAIPFNRNGWHSGDGSTGPGNRKSIGIEICYSKSGGPKYVDAEANAIEYVAHLLKQYGWGIDRVRTHKSWTEIGVKTGASKYIKNCPHRILDEKRWQSFLNRIAARLQELNSPKKEELKLYKPSNPAIINSTAVVLRRLEQKVDQPLDPKWRQQLLDGTLTESDAIGFLYVAIERGQIVGK